SGQRRATPARRQARRLGGCGTRGRNLLGSSGSFWGLEPRNVRRGPAHFGPVGARGAHPDSGSAPLAALAAESTSEPVGTLAAAFDAARAGLCLVATDRRLLCRARSN